MNQSINADHRTLAACSRAAPSNVRPSMMHMHHCTGGHYSGHPMPAATLPKHSVSHSFPKRAAGSANGAPLSSSSVAHFGKRQGALQVSWSSLPHILGNPQMPNCDAHGSRVQKKKGTFHPLRIRWGSKSDFLGRQTGCPSPCLQRLQTFLSSILWGSPASQTFWVDTRAALRRARSDSKDS